MDIKKAIYDYCLRLGDTSLILGQRMGEWISRGPTLEEDIAMTNIALDHIGQARTIYTYAAEVEGKNRTEDDIAYLRSEREYFNLLLAELPNGNFADTIARQFLIDVFMFHYYTSLSRSKDERIAAHAAKALKEVKYHMRHSGEWLVRLGDGTDESHKKMQKAIDDKWMFTHDLFEMNETDRELISLGIAVDLDEIVPLWNQSVDEVFKRATIQRPPDGYNQTGRLEGKHTEYLGQILGDMQYLQRAYPNSKW